MGLHVCNETRILCTKDLITEFSFEKKEKSTAVKYILFPKQPSHLGPLYTGLKSTGQV